VCCFDPLTQEHYCSLPCRDEVVDDWTCARDHQGGNECPGCLPGPIPGMVCTEHSFTEYSGLEISECSDGCWFSDHHTTTEVCYVERQCVDSPQEDALCMYFPSTDELGCVWDDIPIVFCNECECEGPVIYTYTRETCKCQ